MPPVALMRAQASVENLSSGGVSFEPRWATRREVATTPELDTVRNAVIRTRRIVDSRIANAEASWHRLQVVKTVRGARVSRLTRTAAVLGCASLLAACTASPHRQTAALGLSSQVPACARLTDHEVAIATAAARNEVANAAKATHSLFETTATFGTRSAPSPGPGAVCPKRGELEITIYGQFAYFTDANLRQGAIGQPGGYQSVSVFVDPTTGTLDGPVGINPTAHFPGPNETVLFTH